MEYHDLPDQFTRDYVECALWSSNDNADDSGGDPLDNNYSVSDIEDETIEDMILDCKEFQEANAADLALVAEVSHGGHDFWLTRNGHGAGFWDRKYRQPPEIQDALDRLTEASRRFGEYNLWVDKDDGDGIVRSEYTRAHTARVRARRSALPHGRCEGKRRCAEHAQDASVPSCKRHRRQ